VSWSTVSTEELAPGVRHDTFRLTAATGDSDAHLLTVDLANPKVRTDLITAPYVAQRISLDTMADDAGALAAINGDYFNMFENNHPVIPTDAADGPEVRDHQLIKTAVSPAQRFGETEPKQINTGTEVIGVADGRRAMITRVGFQGWLSSGATGRLDLAALNSFAVNPNTIGVYTPQWGPQSRARVVCGTDTAREAPCDTTVTEVIVRHHQVIRVTSTPGSGQLTDDEVAIVGRGYAATALRALTAGDQVETHWSANMLPSLRWGVGAAVILRDGKIPARLDQRPLPGTGVGISSDGHTLYLLVVDGRTERSAGLSINEMAAALLRLGATDGITFDTGGSTAMVGRYPDQPTVHLLDIPSTNGIIRPVPNGLGIFSH
jgi:hypothetical protein